jgi:hypothetical protein
MREVQWAGRQGDPASCHVSKCPTCQTPIAYHRLQELVDAGWVANESGRYRCGARSVTGATLQTVRLAPDP